MKMVQETYITSGKITSLEHETRNDAVETSPLVPETVLASAQSSEVCCSLGYNIVVKLEHNPGSWSYHVI